MFLISGSVCLNNRTRMSFVSILMFDWIIACWTCELSRLFVFLSLDSFVDSQVVVGVRRCLRMSASSEFSLPSVNCSASTS